MILIVRADDGSLISCKLCLSVLMEEHLPWVFCRLSAPFKLLVASCKNHVSLFYLLYLLLQ